MKKISPKNQILKGVALDSILFPLEGLDEYVAVIRVKKKKGKGFGFVKIKVLM